jgi:hypothetical protein
VVVLRTVGDRGEVPDHGVRRIRLGGGRRELALRDLEARQRRAELDALLGVPGHLPDQLLRARRAPGGEREAAGVEDVHGDAEPLPHVAEDVVGRDLEVGVEQLRLRGAADAHLPHRADDLEAGHVRADDEGRRALRSLAAPLDLRLCEGGDDAGAVRVPDPVLAAVQQPVRAVGAAPRLGDDVLRVGAGLRLGERVGGERLAAREHRQVARLLLGTSEEDDRLRPEPAVHADEHAARRVDRRHGGEDARVAGGRQAEPAVLLRDRDAEQADLGECRDDLLRDALLLVDARGVDQVPLHRSQLADQSADDARLVRVALVERGRVGEEERVVDGAGEEAAHERRLGVGHWACGVSDSDLEG